MQSIRIGCAIGLGMWFLVSCDDNDEVLPASVDPVQVDARLSAADQRLSQNTVIVSELYAPQPAWLLVYADDGSGAPAFTTACGDSVYLPTGVAYNMPVRLGTSCPFADSSLVWVVLHEDSGQDSVFAFNGTNGQDEPIVVNGAPLQVSINLSGPVVAVNDQPVTDSNTVFVTSIEAVANSWLVLREDDGNGVIDLTQYIGKVLLPAGSHADVEVFLPDSVALTTGQEIFTFLHLDNNIVGTFEFDGSNVFDALEIFGPDTFPGNLVLTSFEVQ